MRGIESWTSRFFIYVYGLFTFSFFSLLAVHELHGRREEDFISVAKFRICIEAKSILTHRLMVLP